METRTTSAVKAPVSANSHLSQRSKSLASESEVDKWRLRDVVLEQGPEGRFMRVAVPGLELRQRALHVGRRFLRRREAAEHGLRHRLEVREHLDPCLAVARPSEPA